nr:hypothetical protein [Desulfobacterales bacterium]
MEKGKKDRPDCYGRLSTIFPVGERGVREIPESCFECLYVRDCLKEAISGPEGLKLQEERIGQAYRSGQIGFFKRWYEKKRIHDMIKAVSVSKNKK